MLSDQECQFLILKYSTQMLDNKNSLEVFVNRENEYHHIKNHIINGIHNKKPSILRLYGPPGTGKTHTVLCALESLQNDTTLTSIDKQRWSKSQCLMNGAMLDHWSSALKLFLSLCLDNSNDCNTILQQVNCNLLNVALESFSNSLKKINHNSIVIIDEADQLDLNDYTKTRSTRKQSNRIRSPLSLFIQVAARCGVICLLISNTLPHKEKKHFCQLPVDVIIFQSYTVSQLTDILERRLTLAKEKLLLDLQQSNKFSKSIKHYIETHSLFTQDTKFLILRRLTAHHGDCRRMLETCRCILEEKLNESSKNNGPLDSDSTSAESSPRIKSTKSNTSYAVIDYKKASQVVNLQFEKESSRFSTILTELPLQQQILLCAICLIAQKRQANLNNISSPCDKDDDDDDNSKKIHDSLINQNQSLNLQSIHDAYQSLCSSHHIPVECDFNFLIDALDHLQSRNILEFSRKNSKSKSTRGAIRNRQKIYSSFRNVFGAQYSQQKLRSSEEIELLLSIEDVCEILKNSKQLFKIWLEEAT